VDGNVLFMKKEEIFFALVLGQATGNFGLTRLTMAQTQGKPSPSPI